MVIGIVGVPFHQITEDRSVEYVKVFTDRASSAETNDNRCVQNDRVSLAF